MHLRVKPYARAVNLLAPGRRGNTFTTVFFKLIIRFDILGTSREIGLR